MKQCDLLGPDGNGATPARKYTDTQRLTGFYINEFQRKFGERPVVTPGECKALKLLVAQFGYEKVRSRLVEYLAWDDEFAANAGYPIWLLSRCWNRLTAQAQKRGVGGRFSEVRECAHEPRCRTLADHTRRRIDEQRVRP
jgi:hypothetical protein